MVLHLRVLYYYILIGLIDSSRAKMPLVVNATVFSGVCLLLLIVEGLKGGLVQELRHDIAKSPTSTTGYWYATDSSLALDLNRERELLTYLPSGSAIVPDVSKVFNLQCGLSRKDQVSIQATIINDPLLERLAVWRDSSVSNGILLSEGLAEDLVGSAKQRRTPATVVVTMIREDKSGTKSASLSLPVAGVVRSEQEGGRYAYVERTTLEQFVDFSEGEGVAGRPWPGNLELADIGWHGYLTFAKQGYSTEDLRRLHEHGFHATPILEDDRVADAARQRVLYGMVKSHPLFVYLVASGTQGASFAERIRREPSEVESITIADDVAVEWCKPEMALINGRIHKLVGLVSPRRWLYKQYVQFPELLKSIEHSTVTIPGMLPGSASISLFDESDLSVTLADGTQLTAASSHGWLNFADRAVGYPQNRYPASEDRELDRLFPLSAKMAWKSSKFRAELMELDRRSEFGVFPIAFCANELIGAIQECRRGGLSFDNGQQVFNRLQRPNPHYTGRFHVRAIEDVPEAVASLRDKGYRVQNTSADRVIEMRQYVATLDKLVLLLEIIGAGLGFAISVALFFDLTHRRRGTLSMLRLIGFHWVGTMLFIFVRAAMVALTGCSIALLALLCIWAWLHHSHFVSFNLSVLHILFVCSGAVVCSLLGVLPQAVKASMQDPVDGLRLGKVQ
jgi:hypothetical protein